MIVYTRGTETKPTTAAPPAKPAASAGSGRASPANPTLVLFGRNRGGKPCAAWFGDADAEAAGKVSTAMRMQALPLADDAGRELAAKLSRGRMLADGRAHVPLVRRDLFARLVALA